MHYFIIPLLKCVTQMVMCNLKRLHYQISKVFYRHIWRINTIKADSTADIFMELLRAIIRAIIFMLHVCPTTIQNIIKRPNKSHFVYFNFKHSNHLMVLEIYIRKIEKL